MKNKETIIEKIKKLINIGNKEILVLHKRIKGVDWYIGRIDEKYLMVKNFQEAINYKLYKKDINKWKTWADKRFAKGWNFKTIKIDKNGDVLND